MSQMRDYEGQIEMLAPSKLKPSPDNVRLHSDGQIDFLCELIESFGFDQPIVVDKDMEIIKGHGRLMAAKKLKMKKVPVLVRHDLTKDYAKLSRIVDNDTVEDQWDEETLILEASSIDTLNNKYSLNITDRLDAIMAGHVDQAEHVVGGMVEVTDDFEFECPHCKYRWE